MPGNRFPVFRSEKRKDYQWSPRSIHLSIIVFGHYHFRLAKIPEPDFWPAKRSTGQYPAARLLARRPPRPHPRKPQLTNQLAKTQGCDFWPIDHLPQLTRPATATDGRQEMSAPRESLDSRNSPLFAERSGPAAGSADRHTLGQRPDGDLKPYLANGFLEQSQPIVIARIGPDRDGGPVGP